MQSGGAGAPHPRQSRAEWAESPDKAERPNGHAADECHRLRRCGSINDGRGQRGASSAPPNASLRLAIPDILELLSDYPRLEYELLVLHI
jgi:hypothetical protein